jgi:hypothetical protein
MKRYVWQFYTGLIFCCVSGLLLFKYLPVAARGFAGESPAGAALPLEGNVYLPAVFDNFSQDIKGILFAEDLRISSLAADTADRWTIELLAGDTITITAAPGNSADIELSLFDSGGLVYEQNLSPAGEVVTIADLDIVESGEYELRVQSANGQAANYALMLMDQDSYSFIFQGTLHDGDVRDGFLPEEVDDFWFFNALAGQNLSFTVTTDSNSDAYIEIYDPTGKIMLTIDDTGEGEAESLANYTLPESGFYSIRVGEFDFREMDYQITISIP